MLIDSEIDFVTLNKVLGKIPLEIQAFFQIFDKYAKKIYMTDLSGNIWLVVYIAGLGGSKGHDHTFTKNNYCFYFSANSALS